MIYKFGTKRQVLDKMIQATEREIAAEPMLFSCSADYAHHRGGDLTRVFLDSAEIPWRNFSDEWVIDSRVHMLMEGWFPCIPGWHHDDLPRDRSDGQPDYDHTSYYSEHIMCVLDAGSGSFTEFVDEPIELSEVPVGQVVYREWDKEINKLNPKTIKVANGEIVKFTWKDFHRGTPAVGNGWRWFIRATRNTKRPILNKMRTQVQVYMPSITAGW